MLFYMIVIRSEMQDIRCLKQTCSGAAPEGTRATLAAYDKTHHTYVSLNAANDAITPLGILLRISRQMLDNRPGIPGQLGQTSDVVAPKRLRIEPKE